MLKRIRRLATIATALAVAVALPTLGALAADPPSLPVQMEIGDSWTYGEGAGSPSETGYAGLVFDWNVDHLDCVPAQSETAVDGCGQLQRTTFARPGTAEHPGVTTDLLIQEQLSAATTDIAARNGDQNPRNDVEVILLSVGGNDVSGPVLQACLGGLTNECIAVIHERVDHVDANLGVILASLRDAAGPDTEIVITTYDNAVAHCPLSDIPGASQLGALVLEGFAPLGIVGLNQVIRQNAAANGVKVADTYGRLGPGTWVGDCLHPNGAGHVVIADIVKAALDA